jgi:hypothetical protein
MRWVVPLGISMFAGGCGLTVPETQEFPGNAGDQQVLVQAIVHSIHCDVINAFKDIYAKAEKYPDVRPFTDKLTNWGVQLTLSLKTEEKGTLNPVVVWTPVSPASAIFTLGASATLSADAIRTDKLYFYYTVAELRSRHTCTTGIQPRGPVTSLLIQNDLKLRDWLYDQFPIVSTNEVSVPTSNAGPLKQNVLSHEVSFEVVSAGGLTPAWKLARVSVNQSGTFLAATRDRTHGLIITMGPGDSKGLVGPAKDSHLATDIGASVANSVRSLTLQ